MTMTFPQNQGHEQQGQQQQQRPILFHGPWNRKSVVGILSHHQQQNQHQHQKQHQQHCYTDDRDGEGGRGGDGRDTCSARGTSAVNGSDGGVSVSVSVSSATTHGGTYTLFDLISVGVGGTVGSGIFVLTGYIANHYAGPYTYISFLLSGSAALVSGLSFAEWSARLPRVEGSTYTYAYVSMGEYAAVIAASCLTLEYGVSGAAVARSWGDKVLEWSTSSHINTNTNTTTTTGNDNDDNTTESFFNPLAGVISLCCVVVLACGVQESKRVTNFFTVTKVILVTFMIGLGLSLYESSNMTMTTSTSMLVPTSVGMTSGILRGATSSFFGYLGFDEVCCLANEARHPQDTPKAVLSTLVIVTIIYIAGSIALCGMLPHWEISDTSGFPQAFHTRGLEWAAQVSAVGEIVTLPVVVLISFLAQPRLLAAMAHDGLLPRIFGTTNSRDGNLFYSNLFCGLPMTLLATVVPFSWLDDAISTGILVAFNITNTALLLMRCSTSTNKSNCTSSCCSSSSSSTAPTHNRNNTMNSGGRYKQLSTRGPVEEHQQEEEETETTTNYGEVSASLSLSSSVGATTAVGVVDGTAGMGEEVIAIDAMNGIVSSSYPSSSTFFFSRIHQLQQHYRKSGMFSFSSFGRHLIWYHCLAIVAGMSSHIHWDTTTTTTNTTTTTEASSSSSSLSSLSWSSIIQISTSILTLAYAIFLHWKFPTTGRFGDMHSNRNSTTVTTTNTSAVGPGIVLQKQQHHQQHENHSIDTTNGNERNDNSNGGNNNDNNNDNDDDDNDNDNNNDNDNDDDNDVFFKVPCCPFLPLLGIYLNWYLIAQLEWKGILLLLGFLGLISGLYLLCINGTPNNNNNNIVNVNVSNTSTNTTATATAPSHEWDCTSDEQQQQQQQREQQQQTVVVDGPILLREMSLPKR